METCRFHTRASAPRGCSVHETAALAEAHDPLDPQASAALLNHEHEYAVECVQLGVLAACHLSDSPRRLVIPARSTEEPSKRVCSRLGPARLGLTAAIVRDPFGSLAAARRTRGVGRAQEGYDDAGHLDGV